MRRPGKWPPHSGPWSRALKPCAARWHSRTSRRVSRPPCKQPRTGSKLMAAASPSALLSLTLVEAAEAVRKGETTSLALTKASIEAFRTKDGPLNSIIRLDAEEALEAAEGLDKLR